jgi:streptogramin lyase
MTTMKNIPINIVASGLLTALTLLASGCVRSLNLGTQKPAVRIDGKVQTGQQPVAGAAIQLYAVGITGIKSAATPLLAAAVITRKNGSFTIANWNCTSNTAAYGTNPQLYVVAIGGNPGLGKDSNNSASAMMTALGPCDSLNASSSISIDEVTTVASVYALAPFMADFNHIGAQGASAVGLVNAFKTAGILANTTAGTAPGAGLPTNATAPVAEIYALSDLIASCIDSNGSDADCAGLFAAATPPEGSAPADTIAAMLNIAHHPGSNVGLLFNLIPAIPPYEPALTTAPKDWTITLKFTGGGLSSPTGIALDAQGDAWVANAGGNTVTELGSTGVLLTGATGYTDKKSIFGAQAIAVDKSGNVWIADTLLNSVVELKVSNGAVQSSATYTSGGISGPIAIAIDSQSHVWVSNFAGGSVTELTSAGMPVGLSPLTAGGTLENPAGVAIDTAGDVWVTDNSASIVAEFANNQSLLSGEGFTDNAILAPTAIVLDESGKAWVADSGNNAISLFAANGNPLPASPISGGGLNMPAAVAVDGQGVVWVANPQTAGSISELAFRGVAILSPPTGFAVLNTPSAIAVDASGSVWTANSGDNSVSEIVGVAAPTLTPIAAHAGP